MAGIFTYSPYDQEDHLDREDLQFNDLAMHRTILSPLIIIAYRMYHLRSYPFHQDHLFLREHLNDYEYFDRYVFTGGVYASGLTSRTR